MTTTTSALDGLLYIRNGSIGARWNFPLAVGTPAGSPGGLGTPVHLTYSFPTSLPAYAADMETGFVAFTEAEIAATRKALALFEQVADIDFVEVSPGAGDFTFARSDQTGSSAYAYPPSYGWSEFDGLIHAVSAPWEPSGGVWFNNATFVSAEWQPGGGPFQTLLHEIGHGLGLKHPFDGTHTLPANLSTMAQTVMAYSVAPDSVVVDAGTLGGYSYRYFMPETLMAMDIQALQYLYGANTDTGAGPTVYRWDTSQVILRTIWDGGGTDTFDCSNQVFACRINLGGGAYSSIGLRTTDAEIRAGLNLPGGFTGTLPVGVYTGKNNVAIARGAVIENATGGSADDQIIGNAANNLLVGGGGNDTMTGGKGDDSYALQQAGDVIGEAAGGGIDTVLSYLAEHTLASNLENGRLMVAGSLSGNAADNVLFAGGGNSVLAGQGGIDTLSFAYASGRVTFSLASTAVQATGGSASDRATGFESLAGSRFGDQLTGSSVANVLTGAAGADVLSALGGNDTLAGGGGADRLTGGFGSDTFDFDAAAETGVTAASRDVVTDFNARMDRLDLSGMDANATRWGNQAFTFIGSAAFSSTNAAGQLRLENGVVLGSTDADAAAEFMIELVGVSALPASTLVL